MPGSTELSDPTAGASTDRDPFGDGPVRSGAKSLLLTMLGEFVYPTGGSVWTSTIVRGLATVGITERNARQAIARLGDRGIVESERVGRHTRWHLTEPGTRLLANGSERIYSFGRRADDWDGTWLLVICAIPETQRAVRHRFRTRLTFEGFGFLAPTIAVSPHADREPSADAAIAELGLGDTAMTFRSASGAMTDDADVLATAWDLDELAAAYAEFVDEFTARSTTRSATPPERAFADTVLLVDRWRRFPFVDPELPSALLPETWIGARAQEVFDRARAERREAAVAWFAELDNGAG